MQIRILGAGDAAAFLALRVRALREHPDAFLATPEEWETLPLAEVERRLAVPADRSQATFGAFDEAGALVGNGGYSRGTREKIRHGVAIWGMYVAPEARGRGAGRALLDAILAQARTLDGVDRVSLCVMATNAPARALYESAGFVTWGVEPDAVRVAGRQLDEHHMVLTLRAT